MKKFEKLSPIQEIESNISVIFGILRNQNIPSKEYSLILFLLSIYKDGLLSVDILKDRNQPKSKLIEHLNSVSDSQYTDIFEHFVPSLSRFSEDGIGEVFEILRRIDISVLSANFPAIFENVLYRISHYQGRQFGEFIQPVELTRLMCSLAELEPNARVFNPFAGLASFEVYLDQSHEYVGQELNPQTWALGALRLMAYKKLVTSKYMNEDSVTNWPVETGTLFSKPKEEFNLIISTPPFESTLGFSYNGNRTLEQYLIERGINSLGQNSKLITLLPHRFFYRDEQDKRLRKQLIDRDLVDTIISLPNGILPNTNIPLDILVLSRTKKYPNKVRFINAKHFVTPKGLRERVLDDSALSNFIQTDPTDENIIRTVDNKQIRANEYNLNTARYFLKHVEGIRLRDILNVVYGKRITLPIVGKLIHTHDLKHDKVNFTLDISSVEKSEITPRSDIREISESCLLISMQGRSLKPTFFEFEGESIFKKQIISCFEIREDYKDSVDMAYLINELHANYVQEQLESFRLGDSVTGLIQEQDLLEIRVRFPSLKEQRAKVEGLIQAFIKAKEEELKLQKEILGIKEDTFKEFASIKHTFRQYLGAIKSNVVGTRKFLNRKNGQIISLDDTYSEKLNQTLREHLLSIEDTITSLSKLLETDMYTSKDNNVNSLNLIDLVKKAHIRFEQDLFIFEFECDEESFGENFIPLIDINEDDFFKLFSNIVSNAIDHGFKKEYGNIIRSKIKYDSNFENCVLEVSNNGIPMPEKFTFTHLTTRGEKTTDSKGTGIGGADIKDIITTYKGTFELFNDSKSPFPVTYKLNFPISKTIEENEI